MKIKIKSEHPDFKTPKYSHESDAAFDLTAYDMQTKNNYIEYNLGFSIEIPFGYVGLIYPRSSVSNTCLSLTNSVGVIDSGYRGLITARFKRISQFGKIYEIGDRVAQMIIIPLPKIELDLCDNLSESDRGLNGYGSTGN